MGKFYSFFKNNNITVATNGTGDIALAAGGVTSIFDGATGTILFPTSITYDNEYSALGGAPAVKLIEDIFTVSGDDNPYVNMNITAGGVGNTQAKILTEYSSVNLLADIDTTTTPPTNGQVLK